MGAGGERMKGKICRICGKEFDDIIYIHDENGYICYDCSRKIIQCIVDDEDNDWDNMGFDNQLLDRITQLTIKCKFLQEEFNKSQDEWVDSVLKLDEECKQLKREHRLLESENQQLKKEIHLMHMRSMFSTVKSFKGDISQRYKYNEETDKIYDSANHYGQYSKVLDNKEITMLLNEYNTLLGDLE